MRLPPRLVDSREPLTDDADSVVVSPDDAMCRLRGAPPLFGGTPEGGVGCCAIVGMDGLEERPVGHALLTGVPAEDAVDLLRTRERVRVLVVSPATHMADRLRLLEERYALPQIAAYYDAPFHGHHEEPNENGGDGDDEHHGEPDPLDRPDAFGPRWQQELAREHDYVGGEAYGVQRDDPQVVGPIVPSATECQAHESAAANGGQPGPYPYSAEGGAVGTGHDHRDGRAGAAGEQTCRRQDDRTPVVDDPGGVVYGQVHPHHRRAAKEQPRGDLDPPLSISPHPGGQTVEACLLYTSPSPRDR